MSYGKRKLTCNGPKVVLVPVLPNQRGRLRVIENEVRVLGRTKEKTTYPTALKSALNSMLFLENERS